MIYRAPLETYNPITEIISLSSVINVAYGTAQFKLHTRVCITRVYLVTPVEHF